MPEKQNAADQTRLQLPDHILETRIGGGIAMEADHDHLADHSRHVARQLNWLRIGARATNEGRDEYGRRDPVGMVPAAT